MMQPTKSSRLRQRRISRRGIMFLTLQLSVVGALGWRLRNLQVEQSDRFRLLADENRINIRLIAPARGLIFDRNGERIAENHQNYRIVMVREQAGDVGAILKKLARLIPLRADLQREVIDEMQKNSPFVPVTVTEHLSWEEFALVSANAPALPGVIPEVGLNRSYPFNEIYSHIVGYVGPVSADDLERMENPDPLFKIPRYPIGKTGVERIFEEQLRGTPAISQIEVNSSGRVMRELSRDGGDNGVDVQLTVDTALQEYALGRLNDQSAAATVIELKNGDVRAMASTPGFDPNLFIKGISFAQWDELRNNEFRPLADKAVSGSYPPGSTFKMMVALAALEAGVVDPEEKIYCPGHYDLGGRRFHCWSRGGHGNVSMRDSLRRSCDVYYYEISQRVGIENIAKMAQKFGMGAKPKLPLPSLSSGLIPNKAYKQRVFDQGWLIGDTLNSGIGQGFVLGTPFQLALMTARIATGKKVEPRLIQTLDGVPQVPDGFEDLDVPRDYLNIAHDGMFAVVNDSRGTAYASRIDDKNNIMAGKTGTSQVRRITLEEREAGIIENEDLPWKRRDHALFVGFAPYDNPRFAISVVVEHGGGGSSVAAPIARDIMMRALYDGEPPLAAYTPAEQNKIRAERERERLRAAQEDGTLDSVEGDQ